MRRAIAIFVGLTLLAAVVFLVAYPRSDAQPAAPRETLSRRLLVLGIDGMDPKLLDELMQKGKLPNFSRLAAEGSFRPLATSIPPQSPVAWSNMISGADPGTHQIYDFVHRDPAPKEANLAIKPYLSTSVVVPPTSPRVLPLGDWRIPLSGESTKLLRQGPAFWDALVERGIETVIYRLPANYPPPPMGAGGVCSCLCGMGTPDLVGTYGQFTFFTHSAPEDGKDLGGGRLERWQGSGDRVVGTLTGPPNFLKSPGDGGSVSSMTIDFAVTRDPDEALAKFEIQDELVLLQEGEWSDWIAVDFESGIPAGAVLDTLQAPTSLPGMVRFYLKQVHPQLEVYASPLNIDPLRPANPISSPPEFAAQLAEETGRYYTTGIPQDTKALREKILNEEEFLAQCRLVLNEQVDQYRQALARFDAGCLFYYFGAVDQLSHIFWRDRDPEHPGRLLDQAEKFAFVVEDCYVEMDGLLGEALAALDADDTIVVMSDHGFTSFRRGFNLNTWLVQNGYISLIDPAAQADHELFANVDWSKTKAYALGLNALYVNQSGREKNGIVEAAATGALLDDISQKLLAVRDENGEQVTERVYRVSELYPEADHGIAPDLLIGYAAGYRASWATALGSMPLELIEDNLDRWSGDHCNSHTVVPGILVTNRKLAHDDPSLSDIAPSILKRFEIASPPGMRGRSLFPAD